MHYATAIDHEAGIIACALEGELDIAQSIALSKELRRQAAELGYHVLYDASKLREPSSDMPVHDFTVKLSSILDATIHNDVMVAFVRQPGTYDTYWTFYEEAASERGLKVRAFTDRSAAMAWLAAAPGPTP